MPDARANLQPCTWRGVPCHYADIDDDGFGRRVVVFEFLDSDRSYSQDIGGRAGRFKCQLFVVGDDFLAQAAALRAALRQQGAGQLVHPYEGVLSLRCENFRLRYLDTKGRSAWFDCVFAAASSASLPAPMLNTASAATASANNALAAQQTVFSDQFLFSGQPNPVQANALVQMTAAISAVAFMANAPGIDPTQVNLDLAALALAAPGAPFAAALALAVTDYVTALVLVLPSAEIPDQTPDGTTTSSRGAWPVPDATYGLGSLAQWSGPAVPSGLQDQAAVNAAATNLLVQGAATAGLAQLLAQTDFASSNDATAAGTQLASLIAAARSMAAAARPAGIDMASRQTARDIDTANAAWDDLAQASANDLAARGAGLPNLVSYSLPVPRPSLTVANLLYPDRVYADSTAPQPIDALAYQLVARNRAVHPLFMPMQGEALAPGRAA